MSSSSKVFLAMRVPGEPARVFEVFTGEIALWWQPGGLFRVGSGGDGRLEFLDGRLVTTFEDGSSFEIGRVSVWEPGRRLVFDWRQASFGPEHKTEVEVCFEAVGAAETRVSIEHRGWDSIPRRHAARHGFAEEGTLRSAADWWRGSLYSFKGFVTHG